MRYAAPHLVDIGIEFMEARRKSPLVILIPLLLVVAALLIWAVMKQRATPAAAPDAAATTAPARAIAMPAGAAAKGVPGSAMAGAPGGLGGRLPMTEADRIKALAERDRQMAAYEQSHRAEPIDAAWAARAKSDLDSIVTSEAMVASGIKPADYAADCRSATCRVSAQFKSPGDAEDWGTFYLASSGKTIRQAKMTIIQSPAGGSEMRIYGTRK